MILFRSTNGQSPAVNLREALLAGQAPDRGLYFPEKFPQLAPDEIAAFAQLPYHEIAFRVLSKFTEGIIPDDELAAMCRDAYNFPIPLEKIHDRVFLMRLDQGPTASFKDFAAQMMARMFGRFSARRRPAGDHSHRDERRHRRGGGARVSQSSRRPRHRAVSDGRSQREPAQADDHAARTTSAPWRLTENSTTARRW